MTPRIFVVAVCPRANRPSGAVVRIGRRALSAACPRQSQYSRSDFTSQSYTTIYDPSEPTRGPLAGSSSSGVSRVTPRMLKEHLDQFVVGQEHAKRVLSIAVYGHYVRLKELQRQEDELARLEEKAARQAMATRHPVEGI